MADIRHAALLALLLLATAPATTARAADMTVEASGVLPGFRIEEAPGYLAARMNEAGIAGWRFVGGTASISQPFDRVEWKFELNPYAGGGVRQVFPIAGVRKLFGTHRLVSVEVRLYLGSEYQTMVSGQAAIQGGDEDSELAAFVGQMTQNLLGEQGALRAIDMRPAHGPAP